MLAQALMEDVVLIFGMVDVVVVNVDSKLMHVFKEMCTALKIMFWPLARGNHKGNSVENTIVSLIKHKLLLAKIVEATTQPSSRMRKWLWTALS